MMSNDSAERGSTSSGEYPPFFIFFPFIHLSHLNYFRAAAVNASPMIHYGVGYVNSGTYFWATGFLSISLKLNLTVFLNAIKQ